MARKHRHSGLETRTARLKLAIRRRPYPGPSLGRGIALLYRRNRTNGSWVLKASDGHGAYWTKRVAEADDFDDSDGKGVLTFFEAQDAAKKLARGEGGTPATAPLTVSEALTDYQSDLESRGANAYNAQSARRHLTPVLLAKPVALLTTRELKHWRDSLLTKGLKPSTVNRIARCLAAALELARQTDERISGRPWEIGLAGLPDATQARNVILDDSTVSALCGAAYARDHLLGLLVDTLAITGARPSQAGRLRVEDLQDHPVKPKLWMPKSGKGGGRDRAKKKAERYSVPITPALAAKLREAAKGRAADAPLLTQSDGTAWPASPPQACHRQVDSIVTEIGLDPAVVTLYALRHSSIVRQLLQGIPTRLVASLHNSSTTMLEKHYSKFISETAQADDIARRALLHHEPPSNVVALAG
jgi:integrase